jgi:hypothetical protein
LGSFVSEADDDLWSVLAKLLGQGDPGFKAVEESAVRQVQGDTGVDAEYFGSLASFFQSHFGAWREGRWFAVGEIDDTNLVPLLDESCQRSATSDLDIIWMGSHGDYVELRIV